MDQPQDNPISHEETDVNLLLKRLNMLEQKFSLQSYDFTLLRQELDNEKSRRQQLEEIVKKTKDFMKNTTRDSDTACSEMSSSDSMLMNQLKEAFETEKAKRTELEEEVKNLKEMTAKMSTELSVTQERIGEIHTGINENVKVSKTMKEDLEGLRQQLEANVDEIANVKQKISMAANDKETIKNEIEDELSGKHVVLQDRLDSMGTKLDEKANIFKEEIERCKADINAIREIANRVQELHEKKKVSFSTTVQGSIADLQPWQTIIFKGVTTNVGEGYSPATGEFTAKVAGMYIFFAHIMGTNNKGLETCLQVNGNNVMWMYSKGPGHGRDANMVVLHLKVGDAVKVVKHGPFGEKPFYVHHCWSTFSGFLLFTD